MYPSLTLQCPDELRTYPLIHCFAVGTQKEFGPLHTDRQQVCGPLHLKALGTSSCPG